MTIRLFDYELRINVSLVNTKAKLYYIRATWTDCTVGYYGIGQNVKSDIWYPPCNKQYAMCYYRKEAKKQLKMLRYLFRKAKSMSIDLEEV